MCGVMDGGSRVWCVESWTETYGVMHKDTHGVMQTESWREAES